MKKLLSLFAACLLCAASVFGLEFHSMDYVVYGGVGMETVSGSGFKNARLSDVKKYPSNEGSLYLPLADANKTSVPVTVTLGMRSDLWTNTEFLFEGCVGYLNDGSMSVSLEGGLIYKLYELDSVPLSIGVGAKVGGFEFEKYLGKASILAGTTPPVILDEGTIRNGDVLTYCAYGICATPVVEVRYAFSRNLQLNVNAGYQFAYSFKTALEAKAEGSSDVVKLDPKKTDCYYEPRSDAFVEQPMDPKVSLNGLKVGLTVSFRI